MSSSSYGRKLNPYRRLREPLGVKGIRQSVAVTNNPSRIDQNQSLLVRFPQMGAEDVIVPGTARLAFKISLNSEDANRTLVQNIGRAIVKKTVIKISGNEVLSVDDSDIIGCYTDMWRTRQERANGHYQGIDTTNNRNATRLRVGAENKDASVAADKAVADTFGNRFYVPLDFELLESHAPFYQSALGDRLEYELTFNDYSRVIVATGDPDASYEIEGITLEFDMVTNSELARLISLQYSGRVRILFDRILRYRKVAKDMAVDPWTFDITTPASSMKGLLFVFEDPTANGRFARNTERFFNPGIVKVECTIGGKPNQLFAHGMRSHQLWDEARKHFAGGYKRHPETAAVAKDLGLADVSLAEFLTTKYALWLDLRTTDDDGLHDNGRRVEGEMTIQITKRPGGTGLINVYVFIFMDATLHVEGSRFSQVSQ